MNWNPAVSEWLRQVPLFNRLEPATLSLLQQKLEPRLVPAGDFLCREDEPGDQMFVIESGEVAVLKRGEGGMQVEVAVLGPGDITGEMSLLGQAERSASLRARQDTKVWMLSHSAFRELLTHHGDMANALLSCLSQHLRRETSVVAKLLSHDLDRRLKIAFFDSKPYMETVFRERNRYDYAIHYFEPRLLPDTVSMAAGFKVVCVFVNDCVSAPVIEELHGLGVELIALRCAGFNNVDLAACERHSLSVTRVPAYSPYAVAEHAVALMLTLNRRIHRAHHGVREGNFSLNGLVGFDMRGKTFGIVGTARSGNACSRSWPDSAAACWPMTFIKMRHWLKSLGCDMWTSIPCSPSLISSACMPL